MTTRLIHHACTVAALLICSRAAIAAGPSGGRPSMTPAVAATAARRHIAATATPTPSRVSRQVVSQREQFLNLVIRREGSEIRVQRGVIRQANRTVSALDRVDSLLGRVSTGRGRLLQLSRILRLQLGRLNARLERHSSVLVAGLNREDLVLNRLEQVAPTAPEIRRFQLLIDQQTQQVPSLIRPAATPIR